MKYTMALSHTCVKLAVLTLCLATGVFAQSGATGTIVGSVSDSSGAVVSGATVLVTNTAKNVSQQTVTNASGKYSVPSLLPGFYSVAVTANGFSKETVNGIDLAVGKEVSIDVQLKPGSVNQSVNVEASAIGLDTENAAIGQVITGKQIEDLPLNGRNFTQLLLLGAGAVQNSGEQGIYRANEGNSLTIQGARPDSNQYMLDGITINDTYYQTPALVPSIDALQEFQEQTKGYSAAYGGGANQVNLTTRSGTNRFHGTAYDFLRNNNLDARNYFNPSPQPVSPLHQNQFGYTLGGPVWIPKLYNGRAKTFFFAEYEGLRANTSSVSFANVPTTAELGGVFPSQIINPATNTPFPNNTIPQADFSQFGMSAIAHFPAPNVDIPQGNYRYTVAVPSDSDQQSYRIDHQVTTNNRIFGRYTQGNYSIAQPGGILPEGTSFLDEPTRQVVAGYTHMFGPTMVNDLRFGWMNEIVTLAGVAISESEWSAIGLKGLFPYNQYTTYPQIAWMNTGLSAAGGPGYAPQLYHQPTYQISDTLSISRGTHNISLGADVHWFEGYVNNFSSPKFTFSGYATGDPVADMLLGYAAIANAQAPTQFATTPSNANSDDLFYRMVAPWVEDDWKVSKRLTINLGFRYDFMARPHDARDNLFWLDTTIPGGGLYTASKAIIDDGIGGSLYQYGGGSPGGPQWGVLAPRLGLAYRPFSGENTVLRAGYGIFYDSFEAKEAFAGGEYPFAQQSVFYNVNTGSLFPPTAPFAPVTTANLGFAWLENPMRVPYVQMWTASVQHQIMRDTTIEADYLGSAGTHLVGRTWRNAPYPYNPASPSPASARIPYPNIGAILDHPFAFSSNYNALSLKVEHRSGSLTYQAGYIWSHSLDDKSSDAGINGDSSGNGPMDEYNWRLDYSSSSFDIKHHFVGSLVYALPFGRGRALFGNVGTYTNLLVGGWQVNGILTLQTGLPYSVTASDIDFLNQAYGQRADVVGNPYPSGFHRSINEYFNLAAYAQPALGLFGDSGRDILRAPGTENLDFSLFKSMPLGEYINWQTRLEAFNVFNHANFGFPDSNVDSSTFGVIQSAAPGRIVQVAMKLIW
jgi:Carboxypeptidase regulatory-like domain